MTIRPILRYPDPRLSQVAAPVGEITDEIRMIWDDMIDTMEAMPGVGLAAPQIGVMLRLAVVDASDTRGVPVRMADPEILELSPEAEMGSEGSPCLPGATGKVSRAVKVGLSFVDQNGLRVRQDFEGLWARSALHQIDHLNGKLYVEHLSRTKRDMILKKARKAKA